MRQITTAARQLLKQLEGKPGTNGAPMLVGYADSGGVPTRGWGHTGKDVVIGQTITEAQAELDLNADLVAPCSAVAQSVKCMLNDNQFSALVIFVFNVGVEAFKTSTLLKLLNQYNYPSVPDQLRRWDHVKIDGKEIVSAGLQGRRAAEVALWLTPATATDTISPQDQPHTATKPTPPPQPKTVLGTSTGKAQIGVIASGGAAALIQGLNQAQPVLDAVQTTTSTISGLPHALAIVASVMAFAAIAFSAWTLWDRHKKLSRGQ